MLKGVFAGSCFCVLVPGKPDGIRVFVFLSISKTHHDVKEHIVPAAATPYLKRQAGFSRGTKFGGFICWKSKGR